MAQVIINEQVCKGCGLCVRACPKGILALDKDVINAKGYNPVSVTDMDQCIGCCSCARMCTDCALEVEK